MTSQYRVAAESAAAVCAAAARACSGTDADFEETPEDCEVGHSGGPDFCGSYEICSRPIQLAQGVSAVVTETRNYDCAIDDLGNAQCTCAENDEVTHERFQGVDLVEGCGFARAYCRSESITPAGTPSCGPASQSEGSDHCETGQVCSIPIALDDGTILETVSREMVNCSSKTGRPSCVCTDDGDGYFSFAFTEGPIALETCAAASELCLQKDDLVTDGSYDCETSSQSVSGPGCETILSCSQPATIAGTAIVLGGSLAIRCTQGSAESWDCRCVSQNADGSVVDEATVTTEASTGTDACSAAVVSCQESVEVVFDGTLVP